MSRRNITNPFLYIKHHDHLSSLYGRSEMKERLEKAGVTARKVWKNILYMEHVFPNLRMILPCEKYYPIVDEFVAVRQKQMKEGISRFPDFFATGLSDEEKHMECVYEVKSVLSHIALYDIGEAPIPDYKQLEWADWPEDFLRNRVSGLRH